MKHFKEKRGEFDYAKVNYIFITHAFWIEKIRVFQIYKSEVERYILFYKHTTNQGGSSEKY